MSMLQDKASACSPGRAPSDWSYAEMLISHKEKQIVKPAYKNEVGHPQNLGAVLKMLPGLLP